jgi:hypothetical protein
MSSACVSPSHCAGRTVTKSHGSEELSKRCLYSMTKRHQKLAPPSRNGYNPDAFLLGVAATENLDPRWNAQSPCRNRRQRGNQRRLPRDGEGCFAWRALAVSYKGYSQ